MYTSWNSGLSSLGLKTLGDFFNLLNLMKKERYETFKVVHLQIIELRCRQFFRICINPESECPLTYFFQVWTENLEQNHGEWDSPVMLFDPLSSALWDQSFKVISCGARALLCMLLKPSSRICNRSPILCF